MTDNLFMQFLQQAFLLLVLSNVYTRIRVNVESAYVWLWIAIILQSLDTLRYLLRLL